MKSLSEKYKYTNHVPSTCTECESPVVLNAMPVKQPSHFGGKCKECFRYNSLSYKALEKKLKRFNMGRRNALKKLQTTMLNHNGSMASHHSTYYRRHVGHMLQQLDSLC